MRFAFSRLMVLIIPVLLSAGCYYFRSDVAGPDAAVLKKACDDRKYFIIHQGDSVWNLSYVKVDSDRREISGVLKTLPGDRMLYKTKKEGRATRFRNSKYNPQEEAHIYLSRNIVSPTVVVSISMDDISSVEMYRISRPETVATHGLAITGALGIMAGILIYYAINHASMDFKWSD